MIWSSHWRLPLWNHTRTCVYISSIFSSLPIIKPLHTNNITVTWPPRSPTVAMKKTTRTFYQKGYAMFDSDPQYYWWLRLKWSHWCVCVCVCVCVWGAGWGSLQVNTNLKVTSWRHFEWRFSPLASLMSRYRPYSWDLVNGFPRS